MTYSYPLSNFRRSLHQMSETTKPTQLSSNSSYGYNILPGELRNLIRKEILVPGEVWIRPPPLCKGAKLDLLDKIWLWLVSLLDSLVTLIKFEDRLTLMMSKLTHLQGRLGKRPKSSRRIKRGPCTAYRFLASCKQARQEDSATFYSQNTFHLPPGPVANTEEWLQRLRPEDVALLDSMVLDFSLLDLEPRMLDIIYIKAVLKSFIPFRGPMPAILIDDIQNHLFGLWRAKLAFLERWQENNNGRTAKVSRHAMMHRAGWRSGRIIRRRLQRRGSQEVRHCLIQRDHVIISRSQYKMRP